MTLNFSGNLELVETPSGSPALSAIAASFPNLSADSAPRPKLTLFVDNATKLQLPGPTPDTIAASAEMVRRLRDQHAMDVCDCQGNGRRKAEPLVLQLAGAQPENQLRIMDDVLIVWRHTSRVGHHVGIERMLRSNGTRAWVGPAEPWQRAQMFIAALKLYASVVGWCAERFDESLGRQLMEEIGSLTHAEVLQTIAAQYPDQFR